MEMALAPESPKIEQQSQKTLVVEVVSLRPIEKFRRAVAKMPRVSHLTISKKKFLNSTAIRLKQNASSTTMFIIRGSILDLLAYLPQKFT